MDKKLEIAYVRAQNALSVLPEVDSGSARFGQAGKIHLTWDDAGEAPPLPKMGESKGCYFQIDGEGGIVCSGSGGLLINHGGQIRIAIGPFRKKRFADAACCWLWL